MHKDYCNPDSIFHRGLLAGRRVIRKCALTKSEAQSVNWTKRAFNYFEGGWTRGEKDDFLLGFEEGTEEGIADLE
jgi:hypothetical protein